MQPLSFPLSYNHAVCASTLPFLVNSLSVLPVRMRGAYPAEAALHDVR